MSVETPQPEYRQVVRILRERIQAGVYSPGTVLPSESDLATDLKVARATVNKALTILRTEGLVRPQRGRGTTVNPIPVLPRNGIARQRQQAREADESRGAFDGEIRSLGLTPRTEVIVEWTSAPADVAELLGVDEGATVLARRRTMYVDEVPVQLATSYFPQEIAEGTQLAEVDTGPGGAYSRLAELGHKPVTLDEETRVRAPEDAETRALGMDPDQRVLAITRTALTSDDRVVEVNEIVLPAHQWALKYRWVIE
jgi:GntR family transcriptional regulator